MTKKQRVDEYIKIDKQIETLDWVTNQTGAWNEKWLLLDKLNNLYEKLTEKERKLLPNYQD